MALFCLSPASVDLHKFRLDDGLDKLWATLRQRCSAKNTLLTTPTTLPTSPLTVIVYQQESSRRLSKIGKILRLRVTAPGNVARAYSSGMASTASGSTEEQRSRQQQPMLASQRAKLEQAPRDTRSGRISAYFPLGYKEGFSQWVSGPAAADRPRGACWLPERD